MKKGGQALEKRKGGRETERAGWGDVRKQVNVWKQEVFVEEMVVAEVNGSSCYWALILIGHSRQWDGYVAYKNRQGFCVRTVNTKVTQRWSV